MNLVYFSPVPWASFAQRPHKFVEQFHAKTGGKVLWVDPYPARLPTFSDFARIKVRHNMHNLSEDIPNWLTPIYPKAFPIEPLRGLNKTNNLFWSDIFTKIDKWLQREDTLIGVGKPLEFACQVLVRYKNRHSFYDAMDDFPEFHKGLSRMSMARYEQKVLSLVSKILVSSTALMSRLQPQYKDVTFVPNACSPELFPPVESILALKRQPPIIGYVGMMYHWFDWDIVFKLAEENPDFLFRLIGPLCESPPSALLNNIELCPPCDHQAAITAMSEFSVGLIPFKLNQLTNSVDPVKYYEYRALNVPVISTSFGEMKNHADNDKSVFLIDENTDYKDVLLTALNTRNSVDDIRLFRIRNSWESRFGESGVW